MDQRKPEHLQSSTTSIPIVGLALVFVAASFFVATSNAHSAADADMNQSANPGFVVVDTLPASQR
ncbi:MAG: hypothetical protein ABJK20_08125 [Halieaceae bacterium]